MSSIRGEVAEDASKVRTLYLTMFDKSYLTRAICLYESWRRCVGKGQFAFYCMDDESANVLRMLSLTQSHVICHDEFASDRLLAVRRLRSPAEYCFSSKPDAIKHALNTQPSKWEWVIYVDADMMFFGNANVALAESATDVMLTSHRFSPHYAAFKNKVGVYNAGYVGFKNSRRGREALEWWRERCLEWCSVTPQDGKYGDQKYLDHLPEVFGVAIPEYKGLNVAPWNVDEYTVGRENGAVLVDDEKLLLYHFQGFKIHGKRVFDMYSGTRRLPKDAVKHIYRPYMRALVQSMFQLQSAGGDPVWSIQSSIWSPGVLYLTGRKLMKGVFNVRTV